jgi:flagellin-specific chaperone FliS
MAIEENAMLTKKNNLIAHVKKTAKKLHKTFPEISHSQFLIQTAQDLGFRDYHDLLQQNKVQGSKLEANICLIDKYSEIIKKVLADCIDKEQKDELVNEFFGLLSTAIVTDSNLKHVEQLTRWTIDKEKLKQYGYSCHEGENKQYEDLGYILVAIGHYYRSLMDNCSYQIGEHINFKSYFGYWLRAMHPNAQTNSPVLEALKHFYPTNGDQGLSIGATSWAPTWWLQEQGRI